MVVLPNFVHLYLFSSLAFFNHNGHKTTERKQEIKDTNKPTLKQTNIKTSKQENKNVLSSFSK
jgi:hypothetical protein